MFSRDGSELYFIDGNQRVVAARIAVASGVLTSGAPAVLMRPRIAQGLTNRHAFALTDDGQRFLVETLVPNENSSSVHLLLPGSGSDAP